MSACRPRRERAYDGLEMAHEQVACRHARRDGTRDTTQLSALTSDFSPHCALRSADVTERETEGSEKGRCRAAAGQVCCMCVVCVLYVCCV